MEWICYQCTFRSESIIDLKDHIDAHDTIVQTPSRTATPLRRTEKRRPYHIQQAATKAHKKKGSKSKDSSVNFKTVQSWKLVKKIESSSAHEIKNEPEDTHFIAKENEGNDSHKIKTEHEDSSPFQITRENDCSNSHEIKHDSASYHQIKTEPEDSNSHKITMELEDCKAEVDSSSPQSCKVHFGNSISGDLKKEHEPSRLLDIKMENDDSGFLDIKKELEDSSYLRSSKISDCKDIEPEKAAKTNFENCIDSQKQREQKLSQFEFAIKCEFCSFVTDSQLGLKRHKMKKHPNQFRSQCRFVNYYYGDKVPKSFKHNIKE